MRDDRKLYELHFSPFDCNARSTDSAIRERQAKLILKGKKHLTNQQPTIFLLLFFINYLRRNYNKVNFEKLLHSSLFGKVGLLTIYLYVLIENDCLVNKIKYHLDAKWEHFPKFEIYLCECENQFAHGTQQPLRFVQLIVHLYLR